MKRGRIVGLLATAGLLASAGVAIGSSASAAAEGLPIAVPPVADPILDGLVARGLPADAPTKGVWSSVLPWNMLAIQAAVMPDGKVVTWGAPGDGDPKQLGIDYAVWDPQSSEVPRIISAAPATDSFCSLASIMPDGKLLIASGGSNNSDNSYEKSLKVTTFDPWTQTNVQLPNNLNHQRWYGTMVAMPDGRYVVVGGGVPYPYGDKSDDPNPAGGETPGLPAKTVDEQLDTEVFTTPEIRDPNGVWRLLGGAASRDAFGPDYNRWWYPRAWLAPNGKVFGISTDKMWYLNPNANGGDGATEIVGNFKTPANVHAPNDGSGPNVGPTSTAVMYAPGKILQVGGNGYYNDYPSYSSSRATTIDINGPAPVVSDTTSMFNPRQWASSTVLPNGDVLITGGTRYSNADHLVDDGIAWSGRNTTYGVRAAESWNPTTGRWTQLAQAASARLYHSTAVLLTSGAVLTAGGGAPVGRGTSDQAQVNAEVFYPPYFFATNGSGAVLATRPAITRLSANKLGYDQALQAQLSLNAANIAEVALVDLSVGTHSFNNSQRRIPLTIAGRTGNLTVQMPSDPNVAPPGFYQLVVVDNNGVPSTGTIIGLGTTVAPPTSSTVPPTTTVPPAASTTPPTTPPSIGQATGQATTTGQYVGVVPDRVLDTRASGTPAAGATIPLTVTNQGTSRVPANASAVVVNVTGDNVATDGYVTVWACDKPQPPASSLNLTPGSANSNTVITAIDPTGQICLYTNNGANLIVDIDGYFPAGAAYTGVVPDRVLDTRASGTPAAGATIPLTVTNQGTSRVPANASAVVVNVTGDNVATDGYVTVWACDKPQPPASSLNLTPGSANSNTVITAIDPTGQICLYTNNGADLIVDIDGYFPGALS